jgi:hypothetical protein
MRLVLTSTILATALAFAACGKSGDSGGGDATPQRVGDATPDDKANRGPFNAGSGLEETVIELDLAYTPTDPNVAALPSCYATLPSTFEIGSVFCAKTGATTPLLAGHVTQVCSNGKQVRVKPSLALSEAAGDCQKFEIGLHRFDPSFTLTEK